MREAKVLRVFQFIIGKGVKQKHYSITDIRVATNKSIIVLQQAWGWQVTYIWKAINNIVLLTPHNFFLLFPPDSLVPVYFAEVGLGHGEGGGGEEGG